MVYSFIILHVKLNDKVYYSKRNIPYLRRGDNYDTKSGGSGPKRFL